MSLNEQCLDVVEELKAECVGEDRFAIVSGEDRGDDYNMAL
jgi:hypothetical protein